MHGVILLASFVEAGVKVLGSEVTKFNTDGRMIYGIPMVARDGTVLYDTQCSYIDSANSY